MRNRIHLTGTILMIVGILFLAWLSMRILLPFLLIGLAVAAFSGFRFGHREPLGEAHNSHELTTTPRD